MLIALLLLNLAVLGGLVWYVLLLRRSLNLLHEQLRGVSPLKGAQPDLADVLGHGRREIIAIEILNPMELAAKESWFAEKFGSLTPNLVRKIVHDQAMKIVEQQLQSFGAKAAVKLHRAA